MTSYQASPVNVSAGALTVGCLVRIFMGAFPSVRFSRRFFRRG